MKVAAVLLSNLLVLAANAQYLGPTPYLSEADSPFTGPAYDYFHLEKFETGAFSVPGVSKTTSTFLNKSSNTDSVDADDGTIDGFGRQGRSLFFSTGSTGITLTFDPVVLGTLPSYAGVVWTDGIGMITFEAFDALGNSLGTHTGIHADSRIDGTTGEDRFYGVILETGISKIKLKNNSGGVELDHLQFGRPTQRFSISGNVTFQNLSSPTRQPATITVDFRQKGTQNVIFTRTADVDASGNFTVDNLVPLNYDVAAKAGTWLRKMRTADLRNASAAGLSYDLINGDCDGNNSIGTDDYLILNAAFDKSLGDSGFDARGDLNRDDYVGTDDYLILNEFFDIDGD